MSKGQGVEVVAYDQLDNDTVKAVLLGEGKMVPKTDDPTAATRAILERILVGESAEAVFAPSNIIQGKAFIGVPFRIDRVDWYQSDFEDGPGIFAVVSAVVLADCIEAAKGEVVKISLGGAQVIAQLYKAVVEGWLPVEVVQRTTDKPTKAGYYPKWLELPAAEA